MPLPWRADSVANNVSPPQFPTVNLTAAAHQLTRLHGGALRGGCGYLGVSLQPAPLVSMLLAFCLISAILLLHARKQSSLWL